MLVFYFVILKKLINRLKIIAVVVSNELRVRRSKSNKIN